MDVADLDEQPGLVQPGERRIHSPSDLCKFRSLLGDLERAYPPLKYNAPDSTRWMTR